MAPEWEAVLCNQALQRFFGGGEPVREPSTFGRLIEGFVEGEDDLAAAPALGSVSSGRRALETVESVAGAAVVVSTHGEPGDLDDTLRYRVVQRTSSGKRLQ